MFFNKKPKCCFCGCKHKDVDYVTINSQHEGEKYACKMCATLRGYGTASRGKHAAFKNC